MTTSQEPMYHYVKGHGWVAGGCDMRSIDIHKWRITVFDEPPKENGYYAKSHGGKSLDEIIEMIRNQAWIFKRDSVDLERWKNIDTFGGPFLRVEVERV